MRKGDRVTVTVQSKRVWATVVTPSTVLGNVEVDLDEPIDIGTPQKITRVVRDPRDVQVP